MMKTKLRLITVHNSVTWQYCKSSSKWIYGEVRKQNKGRGNLCELESDFLASAFNTQETFYKLYDTNIFVSDTNTVLKMFCTREE